MNDLLKQNLRVAAHKLHLQAVQYRKCHDRVIPEALRDFSYTLDSVYEEKMPWKDALAKLQVLEKNGSGVDVQIRNILSDNGLI